MQWHNVEGKIFTELAIQTRLGVKQINLTKKVK